MSLHKYIMFNIQPTSGQPTHVNPGSRWAWRKANRSMLLEFFEKTEMRDGKTAEEKALFLSEYLEAACNSCMPRGTYNGKKKPVHWWTVDIFELRKACLKARRKLKRSRLNGSTEQGDTAGEEYKEAKKKLKLEIKRSKHNCWSKLCEQVEKDPWGLPYKLVTKKLLGRRPILELTLPGRMESIVNALFPISIAPTWPLQSEDANFPEVTLQEIKEWGYKVPVRKAPGPDGIPDFVVKLAAAKKPEVLRSVFNTCFRTGIFPRAWKRAKLVLLRKGSKPLD